MSMCLKDGVGGLLFVGFNQDNGCFACGTVDGFLIFNVDPYRETFRRIFSKFDNNSGIGIVEMLFRCNLIALVGGGRFPKYPTNKVMIWDDHQGKCIGELTFNNEVLAIKLRRDRVVVILLTKVYVYRFSDLKLIDQIATISNPRALVSLCPDTHNNVLAVPGLARGTIRIELYDIKKTSIIKAHDSDLAQFVLNSDGNQLATASEKGTLIRVWNAITGDLLKEFRRGSDKAEIYCLTFNIATTFLACSSDKGTIHIFSLTSTETTEEIQETRTTMGGSENITSDININQMNITTTTTTAAAAESSRSYKGHNTKSSEMGSNMISSDQYKISESLPTGMMEADSNPYNTNNANNNTYGNTANTQIVNNKGFGFQLLKSYIPTQLIPNYIKSEWSYAQIHGLEYKSICAFDKTLMRIYILSADGNMLVCSFEERGECKRLSAATFYTSNINSSDHI